MANRAQREFESAKVYKDLVILLDESTSIKPANFEFAKNLVKNIVSSLCGGIGPDKNRVAVIRYSAEVKDDILLSNSQNMNKEQVLKTIDSFEYEPIRNSQFSGTTWTGTAMEYVFDNVLATEVGWRQGVGTIVCNGIVIGDSCYFLSEQTGMFGEGKAICESESKKNAYAHPASDRLSAKEWKVLQKYLAKSESRQAWMGMEFASVQGIDEWVDYRGHFLVSQSDSRSGKAPWSVDQWVDDTVVDRYGCVEIVSVNGESQLKLVNCAEKKQVLCKRNPLDYLSVNTEILLITDGRSNDPRKMGVNVLDMKEKFNGLDVKVSAIGVGKINEGEIRDLTDQRNQVLYLMSWQSVHVFNELLSKIQESSGYNGDTCLPLEVSEDDIIWKKWVELLRNEDDIDLGKLEMVLGST